MPSTRITSRGIAAPHKENQPQGELVPGSTAHRSVSSHVASSARRTEGLAATSMPTQTTNSGSTTSRPTAHILDRGMAFERFAGRAPRDARRGHPYLQRFAGDLHEPGCEADRWLPRLPGSPVDGAGHPGARKTVDARGRRGERGCTALLRRKSAEQTLAEPACRSSNPGRLRAWSGVAVSRGMDRTFACLPPLRQSGQLRKFVLSSVSLRRQLALTLPFRG